MNKNNTEPYRLRITDAQKYATYLTRDKSGRVSYISGDETSLALANLLQSRAAETRFALEDAYSGSDASKTLRLILADIWKNNPAHCPKVECLL